MASRKKGIEQDKTLHRKLVELWKLGTKQQKERVIQIMTRIDPANSQRYREIGS